MKQSVAVEIYGQIKNFTGSLFSVYGYHVNGYIIAPDMNSAKEIYAALSPDEIYEPNSIQFGAEEVTIYAVYIDQGESKFLNIVTAFQRLIEAAESRGLLKPD